MQQQDLKLTKNNTSFKGDVARLVGGTVVAQIIGVITIPIISRFFGPEAYGTVALFTSITSVLTVICCWRYEVAIVIPKDDEEAASVFYASLFACCITTLITCMFTNLYAEQILKMLKSETLLPYKWFIPTFVLLQGIYLTFNYWNSRTKRFNKVALAGVLNSTTTRIVNIISGLFGKVSGGAMIGAYTTGQAVATSTIGMQIIKQDCHFLKPNFNIANIISAIKKYKKFPLLSIWCGFLNTISSQLTPMLLTYFFNSTIVGFFSFGHRLLTMPMSLIGGSLAQVFFQRSSEAIQTNQLGNLTERIFNQLINLGLFPFMLLMIISPELFTFAFGERWYEAGIYSQILAPWVFCNFICSPITSIADSLNKQEIAVFFNLLLVATRFLSIYIGGIKNDIYLGLTIYSISGVLIYMLWSYASLNLAKSRIKPLFVSLLKQLFFSLCVLTPIILLKYCFKANRVCLLAFSFLFSTIYVWQLYKSQPEIINKFFNKFKN